MDQWPSTSCCLAQPVIKNALGKLTQDHKIILSTTVRTEGTQATYKLTLFRTAREDKSFTERFLKTFSSTFYHCSDCKSFDWTQQPAAV